MPSTPRTRVLVVDDAVVVRRIVTTVLDEDPALEVVGTAPNGRIALQKVPQVNPDLITLDVEMPVMDGIETLEVLRRDHPHIPVIMFSTLTDRGASVTMDALLKGAKDYVTKPANVGSVQLAMERIREELIPKIHALVGVRRTPPPPPVPTVSTPAPARSTAPRTDQRVDVVVVGVSTGGPNALAALVPALPPDLAAPVLIVQHMPPMFTELLAQRLDAHSPLAVREASHEAPLAPGMVLVGRGDHHLRLRRSGTDVTTVLDQGPHENSCRPAADVLFRSATEVHGPHVLGVVLTGMGADGRRGSDHIRAAGGHVLVQDRATSVVWGMPGAVVEAGLADEVLPLDEVAPAIAHRVAAGRDTPAAAGEVDR